MTTVRRVIGGMFGALRRLVSGARLPWVLVAVLSVAVAALAAVIVFEGDDDADDAGPAVPAGGTPIAGANEEFDGCELIQSWDAEEVLRGPVRSVEKPTDSPAAATCVWESGVGDTARSFQFSVFRGSDLYDPAAFEDDETFEKVDGVGDDAFFVTPDGVQLHMLAGEFSVLFSVTGLDGEAMDEETVKDELVDLAGRVASGLGRGDDSDGEAAG